MIFLANIPMMIGAIPILCIDLGSDLVKKKTLGNSKFELY
jgi:hypothetical protein